MPLHPIDNTIAHSIDNGIQRRHPVGNDRFFLGQSIASVFWIPHEQVEICSWVVLYIRLLVLIGAVKAHMK